MALPVALQLYTVRDELAVDFRGTIKKVAEMGYQGVEFAGIDAWSADEIKEVLAENGLKCMCSHIPLDTLAGDTDAVLAKCKEIGMSCVAVPYLPEGQRPGDPAFDEVLAKMRKIGEACKKYGLKLLYHNHDFEFKKIGDVYGLDYMYTVLPADILQTELDVCWVNVGGESPVKYLEKYAGRAPVVHLKDFVKKGISKPKKLYELIGIETGGEAADEEEFAFRPIGYGVQDIPAILEASEKAGATWVIVEQDRPAKGDTSLESAKKSRDYLLSLGW